MTPRRAVAALVCCLRRRARAAARRSPSEAQDSSLAALRTQEPEPLADAAPTAARRPRPASATRSAACAPRRAAAARADAARRRSCARSRSAARCVVGVDQNTLGLGYFDPITERHARASTSTSSARSRGRSSAATPTTTSSTRRSRPQQREAAIANGEVDLVASAFSITCERRRRMFFSSVYYRAQPAAARAGRLDGRRASADLRGKRVCATTGSTIDRDASRAPGVVRYPRRAALRLPRRARRRREVARGHVRRRDPARPSGRTRRRRSSARACDIERYGLAINRRHPEFVRFVNARPRAAARRCGRAAQALARARLDDVHARPRAAGCAGRMTPIDLRAARLRRHDRRTATATSAAWRPPRARRRARPADDAARDARAGAPPPRPRRRADAALGRLGAHAHDVAPAPRRRASSRCRRSPAATRREAVMADPQVAEPRRFCGRCGSPVGRSRDGAPGRAEGFCRHCGAPFSFTPKLRAGDVVAEQYEVVGCLAHGGLGWIYLAKDRNVADRWVVLKGLLERRRRGGDGGRARRAAVPRRGRAPEHREDHQLRRARRLGLHRHGVRRRRSASRRCSPRGARPTAASPTRCRSPQAIAYVLEILPALGYLHRSGLLFCDLKLDNVIQTQALAEAHRPRRRLPDRRHGEPGLRHRRATRRRRSTTPARRSRRTSTPSRARSPRCASTSRASSRRCASRCRRGARRRCSQRYDSLLPAAVQGHGARTPTTASSRPRRWPTSSTACCARSSPTRRARRCPARSTLFTADFRPRGDGPDRRLLPALRVATDDPAAGYLATLAAAAAGRARRRRCAARPSARSRSQLRLAQALIDAQQWDEARRAARRDRAATTRGSGARTGTAASRRSRSELPDAALASFEVVYHAVPGELAPKLALGVSAELAGDPAARGRLVRDRLAHRPELRDGGVRARALPPGVRRSRRRAGGVRARAGVRERPRPGADRARSLPARRRCPASPSCAPPAAAIDALVDRRRAAGAADGASCCARRSSSSSATRRSRTRR